MGLSAVSESLLLLSPSGPHGLTAVSPSRLSSEGPMGWCRAWGDESSSTRHPSHQLHFTCQPNATYNPNRFGDWNLVGTASG
jgi:hypothetical protein